LDSEAVVLRSTIRGRGRERFEWISFPLPPKLTTSPSFPLSRRRFFFDGLFFGVVPRLVSFATARFFFNFSSFWNSLFFGLSISLVPKRLFPVVEVVTASLLLQDQASRAVA